MTNWIEVAGFGVVILTLLANIAFSIWGKPPNIQKILEELKQLREENIRRSQEQAEFCRQMKAVWEKIDFLTEMAITHAKKISYMEGKLNGRKNKNTQAFHEFD